MHLQHVNSINECFYPKTFFHKLLNYCFMFLCNEHVEMNTFLCSLACTLGRQYKITNYISL